MAKIAFVTDSTAYIPAELVKKYQIMVAPQILIWEGRSYLDGVDIQPNEFYRRLKTAKSMPTTSQVSVVTIQSVFHDLVMHGWDVLGIFISAKLSGTLQSAYQGREALGPASAKVTIVDSHSTAMAMGFQVLAAARAAEQGASKSECKSLVERARAQVGVYFAVDNLEFLYRGCRIGGA